jgi:hypothetical protein
MPIQGKKIVKSNNFGTFANKKALEKNKNRGNQVIKF